MDALNLDQYGLLNQRQPNGSLDGGDSCHKTSNYVVLARVSEMEVPFKSLEGLEKLEIKPGIIVRNPDPNKWYSRANTLSRDQYKPFIVAAGLWNKTDLLARCFKEHCKRLLLFTRNTRRNWQYPTIEEQMQKEPGTPWNYKWKLPDFTGPEVWAAYIRAFRFYPLYILLPILDIETLIGVLVKAVKKDDDDVANDLSILILGKRRGDNPIQWLSRKIAKRFIQDRMVSYFSKPGEPPLYLYSEQVVKEL